jgi:hypothetical protein
MAVGVLSKLPDSSGRQKKEGITPGWFPGHARNKKRIISSGISVSILKTKSKIKMDPRVKPEDDGEEKRSEKTSSRTRSGIQSWNRQSVGPCLDCSSSVNCLLSFSSAPERQPGWVQKRPDSKSADRLPKRKGHGVPCPFLTLDPFGFRNSNFVLLQAIA